MTVTTATRTVTVCRAEELEDNLGAGVLLPDGTQIALFRVPTGEPDRAGRMPDSTVFAVSNIDPYSGAAVISRGIVGEVNGEPTVASVRRAFPGGRRPPPRGLPGGDVRGPDPRALLNLTRPAFRVCGK
ncbi:nitrite reductase (NAD(P)H) small subunit [Corynebacterium variabile]|uniref:nitrite reductase (NAD(P)H) small subunit n=1 Tax=Corynebacterium variabile TaxID=1727 RepID=UPI0028AB0070|nr:nitrite reductase (NAD(P)H) small subunit [Corynebacterium variabile]